MSGAEKLASSKSQEESDYRPSQEVALGRSQACRAKGVRPGFEMLEAQRLPQSPTSVVPLEMGEQLLVRRVATCRAVKEPPVRQEVPFGEEARYRVDVIVDCGRLDSGAAGRVASDVCGERRRCASAEGPVAPNILCEVV